MKTTVAAILILTLVQSCTQKSTQDKTNAEADTVAVSKTDHPQQNLKEETKSVDPYDRGKVSEAYDEDQIDFSNEFFNAELTNFKTFGVERTEDVANYYFDRDSLFASIGISQWGVIGTEYQRLDMYFESMAQIDGSLTFKMVGKSRVSGNVCDFSGQLTVHHVYEVEKDYDYPGQGSLLATYRFYEDSSQHHVGSFSGSMEMSVLIDHQQKRIVLDESFSGADAYANRTYVGTWNPYEPGPARKCIWGDWRLPYTFDFDMGDGEMYINKKYEANGWSKVNDLSEYKSVDKWW